LVTFETYLVIIECQQHIKNQISQMEFKTDAKTNYTLIQPENGPLSAKMAAELRQKVNELLEHNSTNFIIDLKQQPEMAIEAGIALLELHHQLYENGHSMVFINLQEAVLQSMKKEQLHLSLNLSPTLIEAIDIISMEILERDILNES